LVETYVAGGLGIGVGVAVPKRPLPANVRVLPLKNFPPALIGALWRGKATPLLEAFMQVARQRAKELV
jgi:DNA-binding transcriptional LysR family regulator